MTPKEIDNLIEEWIDLGEAMAGLKERRRAIVRLFGKGRTEGETKDFYVSGRGLESHISVKELRRYVTKDIIDACKVYKMSEGHGRVVPKLKNVKRS